MFDEATGPTATAWEGAAKGGGEGVGAASPSLERVGVTGLTKALSAAKSLAAASLARVRLQRFTETGPWLSEA